MFESLNGKGNRFWTTAAGAVVVSFWVAVLILIPLIYHQDLPGSYVRALIYAPPLSPPPAPVNIGGAAGIRAVSVQFNPNRLYEPIRVPRVIAAAPDVNLPPVAVISGPGLVPGGMPESLPAFGLPEIGPPPPIPVETPAVSEPPIRIYVGGNVQSAKLIAQPRAIYPPLARQIRVQGTVRLEAVINMDGTIENLRVLNGHPLLIPAALDSVRQWRYQPTLLNGEPVEVVTIIEVNFTLAQ